MAKPLGATPDVGEPIDPPGEVRFALDGDAVVFGPASEIIYRDEGLDRFIAHETALADVPMERGPFGQTFLPKLAHIRQTLINTSGDSPVRIIIVTARNAPAHERVVKTLRAWGTPADEAHFVGASEKTAVLRATQAHIFFDDQERHVSRANAVVPSGLVPGPYGAPLAGK